ncbi:phage tail protein I [Novosphingobium sp.]|uniref:phage tail protein I n=1 Tax=Novosphingobium sp. TaxID=1874826 RepID=UPI0031DBA219
MTARSVLPPNTKALVLAFETVGTTRLEAVTNPIRSLWSAQDCPEAFLPWLASTVGVETWDPATPLQLRRTRVAQAITIHRKKGTARSVQDVIAAYGGTAVLKEWFEQEPKGIPRSFTLQIALGGQAAAPTADFISGLMADVTRTKPVGSFFTFTIAASFTATLTIARAARPAVFARLTCHEA